MPPFDKKPEILSHHNLSRFIGEIDAIELDEVKDDLVVLLHIKGKKIKVLDADTTLINRETLRKTLQKELD